MSMLTVEELEQYARIDIDNEDDIYKGEISLLNMLITAAEQYLINATGNEYPEIDGKGDKINYALEKIYLQLLVSHWYEKRSPVGSVGEDFTYSTKSIMLQLQMK
ncbi:MAG TPA: DNA-packaging protein [Lachnospiraceae bacterium]|nr:DNA-packaging protein [Lachnospiraceae bacterium]